MFGILSRLILNFAKRQKRQEISQYLGDSIFYPFPCFSFFHTNKRDHHVKCYFSFLTASNAQRCLQMLLYLCICGIAVCGPAWPFMIGCCLVWSSCMILFYILYFYSAFESFNLLHYAEAQHIIWKYLRIIEYCLL